MTQLSAYNEILHVAHKLVSPMWSKSINIEEKIDGSSISWMLNKEGELLIRSKGQQIHEGSPNSKMFDEGISAIKEKADLLIPGQIWRGEYLKSPKHNTIRYNRIPKDHIVIFDIELSLGDYATVTQRREMADLLGFETVPVLFQGVWDKGLADLPTFFETDSFLGGSKIEGIVAKCYTEYLNGKPLFAKLVSETFKENHTGEWKKSNPGKGDIVDQIIKKHRTEARWRKSIEHYRDDGKLTNSPRDIGPLLKEIAEDVKKEEEDSIKEILFNWAFPKISRGITVGFPEFYKDWLLKEEE